MVFIMQGIFLTLMYEILFLLHFNTFIFDQAPKINVFWRVVKSYQISNKPLKFLKGVI